MRANLRVICDVYVSERGPSRRGIATQNIGFHFLIMHVDGEMDPPIFQKFRGKLKLMIRVELDDILKRCLVNNCLGVCGNLEAWWADDKNQ